MGEYERVTTAVVRARRISWGAVFAGFFIAVSVQYLLGMLGLSIGLTTIEPATEGVPSATTLGVGIVIWWIVTGIIALFLGGWVAGRLAGIPVRMDAALNGVVAWCVTAVVMLVLATSAAGRILNTATSALGYALSTAGYGASAVGRGMASLTPDQWPNMNVTVDQQTIDRMAGEFRTLLEQTGRPGLQPEQVEASAERVQRAAEQAGTVVTTRPGRLDDEAQRVWATFVSELRNVSAAVDKQAVVNLLVARTDMTEAEAQQTVDRWVQQGRYWSNRVSAAAENVQQTAAQAGEVIGEEAAEATEYTAETLAAAAFWSFVAMLLGAGAAFAGGWFGTPFPAITAETRVEHGP